MIDHWNNPPDEPCIPKQSERVQELLEDADVDASVIDAVQAELDEVFAMANKYESEYETFCFNHQAKTSALEKRIEELEAVISKKDELIEEVDRQLAEGFVRCNTCGGQEDTKDFDCRIWIADALALKAGDVQAPKGLDYRQALIDFLPVYSNVGQLIAGFTLDKDWNNGFDAETRNSLTQWSIKYLMPLQKELDNEKTARQKSKV